MKSPTLMFLTSSPICSTTPTYRAGPQGHARDHGQGMAALVGVPRGGTF